MFHSLFTVSIFDINLLMFGMTLQRLKFPANERVHIHKSEKLILCISILLAELCPVLPHLYRTDWLPP